MSLAHTTMQAQFCVVGSGTAAFCAALSAARHGIRTVLLLDRLLPTVSGVEGFRLPLGGASGENNRETGLAEELLLQNLRRAPTHADLLSGQLLIDILRREENLYLIPAITVIKMEREGNRITAFDCWHKASGIEYTVLAACYADCSEGGLYAAAVGAEHLGDGPQVLGDYLLTAADAETEFADTVAYGTDGEDSALFAIPYRCLYARNLENLFCAGAHVSVGADRAAAVSGAATAAILGQAVGTAAAAAVKYGTTPRGVYENHLTELQETLQYDDCFLPGFRRTVSESATAAELSCDDAVSGDILNLRTGIDRCHAVYGEGDQGFTMSPGASVEYHMDTPTEVTRVRIVFDSDLGRSDTPALMMPKPLAKVYFLEVETEAGWEGVLFENENTRRLVTAAVCRPVTGIRLTVMETWGAPGVHLLSFDFE